MIDDLLKVEGGMAGAIAIVVTARFSRQWTASLV